MKLEYGKGADQDDPLTHSRQSHFEAIEEVLDENDVQTSRKNRK